MAGYDVDNRPGEVSGAFHPDAALSLTIVLKDSTGSTLDLTGRTFESTLGSEALSVTNNGTDLTVELTQAQAQAADETSEWRLSEDLGSPEVEPLLTGTWTQSIQPTLTEGTTVTRVVDGTTVEVTSSAGALGAHLAEAGFHAGRVPVVVVAASDADEAVKNTADHVCDGVDDEATFEAAAGSGDVTLLASPGTFKITAENRGIALPTGTTLIGSGRGITVLELQPADLSDTGVFDPNLSWGVISAEGTSSVPHEDVTVCDLTIDGNKQNMTALGNANQGEGIDFEECRRVLVHNVQVLNTPADGIDLDFSDGTVSDCFADNCGGSGVHLSGGAPAGSALTATRWTIVQGLQAIRCGGEHLRSGFDVTLDSGNIVIDGAMCRDGLAAWQVAGHEVVVMNVQEHGNVVAAGLTSGSERVRVVGCRFEQVPGNDGTDNRIVDSFMPTASSEEQGSATIPDTASSVTVPHGLWAAPATVTATPRAVEAVAVTARTATDITISRTGTSGALEVDWTAAI